MLAPSGHRAPSFFHSSATITRSDEPWRRLETDMASAMAHAAVRPAVASAARSTLERQATLLVPVRQ